MVERQHIIIVSMERNILGQWGDMEMDLNLGLSALLGNKIINRTTVAEMGLPCE